MSRTPRDVKAQAFLPVFVRASCADDQGACLVSVTTRIEITISFVGDIMLSRVSNVIWKEARL